MTNSGQGGQWPEGRQPDGQWQRPAQEGHPNAGPHATPPPGFPHGGYPHQATPAQGFSQPNPAQPNPAQPAPTQPAPTMAFPQAGYGPVPQPPSGRGRRPLIIALVVALVALVGGGATWWALAQRDSVTAGASNPTEAVRNLATSVGNNDVVGMLGTLAPAEAKLFTDPIADATGELKRLQVLKADADPKAMTGVQIKTENLQFDDAAAENVNDHVTIAKLTGGKLTLTADFSKVPLAKEFIDSALSSSDRRELERGPQTETIDIGDEIRRSGEPVRIATVKVDGAWYPSMLYTIADNVLHENHTPWPKDSIPANGAASPNEAVRQLAQAGLDANIQRVIELLPPDEMAVLHDSGPAIMRAVGADAKPTGAKITKLETASSPVSGGTRATLTALEMDTPDGKFALSRDGDCYRVSDGSKQERFCADELANEVASDSGSRMSQEARTALRNLGTGVLKQGVGVVTTEVDGKHYVSPLRTFSELGMTVLRSLQPADIRALAKMAN